MPVKDAGWRIEPPVSVPVAARHRSAATAAAEPLDDPVSETTHPALDMLDTIDPDTLTPREALDLIYKLKEQT